MEDAALEAHTFGEGRFIGAVDRFLDHHCDRPRHGRDLLADLDRGRQEVGGRHDAADEPGALGFGGVHHPPGQAQIHRLCLADKARQALRSAGPRHRAELDLGLAEPRGVGGDDDVAHHRDLAAAAKRKPGDRRDHRLPALRDPLPAAGDEVLEIDLGIALADHLLDIGAGGKSLVVAGKNDGTDPVVCFKVVQSRGQFADQRRIQRIQRLRPVQADDADGTSPLDENTRVIAGVAHVFPF